MLNVHYWKKAVLYILLAVTVITGCEIPSAEAKSRKQTRQVKKHKVVPVKRTDLYADIVIEARTGRILHASNATKHRHPASLTKMMTLYLAFQALEAGNLRLDQPLSTSTHAAAQSPSKLGLRPGQTIRVQDAIMGVVTKSANDAAVILAEALGGSEDRFAHMMTRQARALGMNQTTFKNASGLPDPGQVSTARDMAVLGHALIYHYPRFYGVFARESFTYSGQVHRNHNHLMERYDGMDGIKTGYIRASGFNLVASAEREDRRLIGVVFGGRSTLSRDNQMAQLLDQGFSVESASGPVVQDSNEAQGDSNDIVDSHYIALPSKTASVFVPERPSVDPSVGRNLAADESQPVKALPSNWGIQVGAYNDAAAGQQRLNGMTRDMTPLLNRADPILQKVQTSEGAVIFRARFMGMEQATARSVCSYIVKRGQGCVVVAPERVGGL